MNKDNPIINDINVRMIVSWVAEPGTSPSPGKAIAGDESKPLLLTFAGWDPEAHKVVHHVIVGDYPLKQFFLVRTNLNEHETIGGHLHLKQLHRQLGFKKLAQPLVVKDDDNDGIKDLLHTQCRHRLTLAGIVIPGDNEPKMGINVSFPYTIFFDHVSGLKRG